jgi:neopullulanase
MPGGGDPDNRRDFPGGFPGDERNAFTKEGRTAVENGVVEHLKRLAWLRARWPALRRGSLVQLYDAEQQTAFARVYGGQTVVVAFNNDTKPATFEFEVEPAAARDLRVLKVDERPGGPLSVTAGGRVTVTLPARWAGIYSTRNDLRDDVR